MLNKVSRLTLLFMVMFVMACGSLQVAKDNPYSSWSSKKKLTNAINVYATEYDKYMVAIIRPNLTELQMDYLKNKRDILVGLDKTIEVLIPIVEGGGVFTPELEAQLTNYLTLLGFQPM